MHHIVIRKLPGYLIPVERTVRNDSSICANVMEGISENDLNYTFSALLMT
jgi:hypothetical protein